MKGFVKFMSIMAFGFFCFIGGAARGDGKNHVAAYCVGAGVYILLSGYTAALEIEMQDKINSREGNYGKSKRK